MQSSGRSKTEAALADSQARMGAILEAAVEGIISIDEQGIVQTINPAAERLFGHPARDVIGRNVSMLMPPPYRAEHDGYLARYLNSGEKKIIGIGREVVGLRKDGTTFPVDLSVAEARLENGRLFVGIIRDITERKRAEAAQARLAAIVESSDDAIVSKSLDGIIQSWNAGAERLFGYAAHEAIGRPITLIIPPDRQCEEQQILPRIARGEPVEHFETVRVSKKGRRIDVSLTISPIHDNEGRVVGASKVTRDITERRRAEEALRQSKQDLEKAVAELQAKNDDVRAMTQQLWQAAKLASVGELAASIAHELNNPLATVTLRVESLLSRTPTDDLRRKALEIVAQETRRMADLVANLLQFARRGQEQVSTVDVRQELTKAVELIHHHLRKHQVTVVQDYAPDTPIIFADRQKLRQVFLNLLTNAADAMPQGGSLSLRIAPATLDSGKPGVRIEVTDTGVGIPETYLGRVLEPFFTTKEEGKGTGLGLAICRRIAQEHHGTIHIFSEVGQGTTVQLVLPIKNVTNVDPIRNP